MTKRRADAARRRLLAFREMKERRDELIREASKVGLGPSEIHRLSGVSRSQIYVVLERSDAA